MTQPTSADAALRRAADMAAAGRLAEAAAVLAEALREDAGAHEVAYRLALIEAERGNWSDAERLGARCGPGGRRPVRVRTRTHRRQDRQA
jgi:hypothetical protein